MIIGMLYVHETQFVYRVMRLRLPYGEGGPSSLLEISKGKQVESGRPGDR